jgi:serine/threonine protein kinase
MGLGLLPTEALSKSDFVIEPAGTMIGRYKLLEKIGEGGFGVVYMAEQQEPMQRKVALKIIKAGMDTREVIARFEAERQAIALMDHPNIARALDAGATEAGRPYFVMELVRGIPITNYCDQKKLPTRERLELFMKVCQAVQHAHQKGVIHRDLKPTNVLVTEHDCVPVPKVIDFGVAKALGQKLTSKTIFTAYNHMIGTPAYMSPEQAALSGLDIDTRADIYSLGVLLYELLTGVTPFDAETLHKEAMDEVRRMIREIEPPKPSTRLQTLGEKLAEVAKHRHTEPAALSRLVRGDLDWIVMRCLEKDRQRRYETANALAKDLERHLNVEPIVARPPSAFYQFQKLMRRHKLTFAASGAVVASFVVGLGVSTWLFIQERQRADSHAAQSTFNLATDFSATNNPNGAWSFGWLEQSNSVFNLYSISDGLSLNEWHGPFQNDNGITPPNVICNPTDEPITVSDTTWLPHQITFHPGAHGERSVIRWTSLFKGMASLDAAFEGRSGFTTSGVEIYQNSTLLYSGAVKGKGAASRLSFTTNLMFNVGDTVDVRVNQGNGDWSSDTTQIGVVITPAPQL